MATAAQKKRRSTARRKPSRVAASLVACRCTYDDDEASMDLGLSLQPFDDCCMDQSIRVRSDTLYLDFVFCTRLHTGSGLPYAIIILVRVWSTQCCLSVLVWTYKTITLVIAYPPSYSGCFFLFRVLSLCGPRIVLVSDHKTRASHKYYWLVLYHTEYLPQQW